MIFRETFRLEPKLVGRLVPDSALVP